MHTSGIESLLVWISLLLLLSIAASKVSTRLGIPALLLFLGIGMLAGSEGIGGVYFDDAWSAQLLSVIALVLILFAGGLDTPINLICPVFAQGAVLATLGVLITAVVIGWIATLVLDFSFTEGVLLGAIVSATDAAAVFSVLRGNNIRLKGRITPLLELELGTNDPMAVFLTLGLIRLLDEPGLSALELVPLFIQHMALGAAFGYGAGRLTVAILNRVKLEYEGLYPVLTVALALFTYGATTVLGGSGFLAVYLAGLVAGNSNVIHKASLKRFHEGISWLMQIVMFLTLGLLVFPSHIGPVAAEGLLISLALMLLARPLSVFISLAWTRLNLREKAFISWVGLRGAAPIILATFPLLAELPKAGTIFNLVFFIVLTSVLVQGTTLSAVAKRLRLDEPTLPKPAAPIEVTAPESIRSELLELVLSPNAPITGQPIVNAGLPDGTLIVLLGRDNEFIVPTGGTVLRSGDTLLVLVRPDHIASVRSLAEPPLRGE